MSRVCVTFRKISDARAGDLVLFDAGRGVADKPFQGQGRETWLMDARAARTVVAAFDRQTRDLVVDYEHSTIDPSARVDGLAPAAGWIKRLHWDPARGLVASVDWTAQAADLIAKREYGFCSPVFNVGADGRVCELLHAALTNNPATLGARPIAAIAARRRSFLENKDDAMMTLVAAKRIPDAAAGAAGALSPLEQFRDCAMSVMEVLQRRGVALSDRTTANDPDAEREFAAEVQRTFSKSDARALDALCGFVGRHANAMERAGAATDDAEIDVAALSRAFAASAGLQREFGSAGMYIAFKKAEARGAVRIYGKKSSAPPAGRAATAGEDLDAVERRARADFRSLPGLRLEFSRVNQYVAFKRAEAAGKVRICG